MRCDCGKFQLPYREDANWVYYRCSDCGDITPVRRDTIVENSAIYKSWKEQNDRS